MSSQSSYPGISIITPSFNQIEYLESALQSVLLQGYPNLEYIIIDGGSTDGSVDIIRKYEKHLSYWVSESDCGQYHAINKGFSLATGQILGWLNSSDLYCPWTFKIIAEVFVQNSHIDWVTSTFPLRWDKKNLVQHCSQSHGYSRENFYLNRENIQQESTFWRRSLWEKAGAKLDENYQLAADFDLWARFYNFANLYGIPVPLGGNRIHLNQRYKQGGYADERYQIVKRYPVTSKNHLRQLIRLLRLNEIPYIRYFVNRLFGVELNLLIGRGTLDEETIWVPQVIKKLI